MSQKIHLQELILYTDDDILVVNKPPGLLTIQDGYDLWEPHLHGMLSAGEGQLWVVHRLDRDTSGIVIFARTAYAHQQLSLQFETRAIEKIYQALVSGTPDWKQTEVNAPLKVNGDRRHRTVIDNREGKPAETEFRVLEVFRGFSFLEALPHSGYTHQIRSHLASLGFPILGDPIYGVGKLLLLSSLKRNYKPPAEEETPLIQRTALHARQIVFEHPTQQKPLRIEAPYPKDLAVALKQLRKYAS